MEPDPQPFGRAAREMLQSSVEIIGITPEALRERSRLRTEAVVGLDPCAFRGGQLVTHTASLAQRGLNLHSSVHLAAHDDLGREGWLARRAALNQRLGPRAVRSISAENAPRKSPARYPRAASDG